MRKKARLLCLALAAVLALLTGCGNQTPQAGSTLEPYELSQDQEELLELLGLSDTVGVIKFTGPEEATALSIDTYALQDGQWQATGGGQISREEAGEPWEGLAAIQSREDYSIGLRVRTEGIASSYTTDAAAPESDPQGWALQFLDEEMPIVLGEPIPVALFLYSGDGSLRTHALTDFADPAVFDGEGLALVQAVTLTFTA